MTVVAMADHVVAADPKPERSCFNCRHSRHSADAQQLLCRQPRSMARDGVAVADTRKGFPQSVARLTARLCRDYQEEQ